MTRHTPPPPVDLAALAPEFAKASRTTVRLHPRRGDALQHHSKIGGPILWPAHETWPQCAEHDSPLIPVLQLVAADVPELEFPSNTDLFQILWCPNDHPTVEPLYYPTPRLFWRNSADITCTSWRTSRLSSPPTWCKRFPSPDAFSAKRTQLLTPSSLNFAPASYCVRLPILTPNTEWLSVMAEITRERTGMLVKKLLQILKDHPDGLRARDALAKLRESVELTDYESGTYKSGTLRFDKIVRFATIDCAKAGCLSNARASGS